MSRSSAGTGRNRPQIHFAEFSVVPAYNPFLQNVHAACDAFPFVLNVLLGGVSKAGDDYDHQHFKWHAGLVSDVKKEYLDDVELHLALCAFMADQNFQMLAALVNQAKPNFFPSLLCKLDTTTDQPTAIP
jgi:hypothetical protein